MMPRHLRFRQDFFTDASAIAAVDALLRQIFGCAPLRTRASTPVWIPFAYFDGDDRCVACVEAARLELVLDSLPASATAIRLAAVAEAHRGAGLFKDLMTRALAWCEIVCRGPILLYTEDHSLYARYGFAPLAQHAFVSAAPVPAPSEAAVHLGRAEAVRVFDTLAPRRVAISRQCAIVRADDLLREFLRGDDDVAIAWAADLGALIIYETDCDTLVLIDIVATIVPSMAQIVGVLAARHSWVRTMFPPDQLDWSATPEQDETGLMIRGPIPAAMRLPFMLTPTTGF